MPRSRTRVVTPTAIPATPSYARVRTGSATERAPIWALIPKIA
jgi:hypothetical protein